MKKFLKCKIDENETTNQKALETGPAAVSKVVKKENQPVPTINPPLPLDPPPPDSLPKRRPMLTVKEKKDILKHPDDPDSQFNPDKFIKTEHVDEPVKPNTPTVCRDFIRGTCSRTTTCKYAHVKDLNQLQKVYTFCHNFQNAECKFPHCKYVHATIAEEQQFYRTAVLPAHTIAHHKKVNPKLAPPPPHPPPLDSKTSPSQPIGFGPVNAPPIHSSIEKPCLPAGVVTPNGDDPHSFVNNAPGKLTWNKSDNCVGSPRDIDAEHTTQRDICNNCVLMENRLLHTNNKIENIKESVSSFKTKLADLDKKEKRLNALLEFILLQPKTNLPGGAQANNGLDEDLMGRLTNRAPR